jgi:hypothetical protein
MSTIVHAPTKTPRQAAADAKTVAESGSDTDWGQIVKDFTPVLAAVSAIIKAIIDDKNSVAVQGFRQLITTDAWKSISELVTSSLGIKTIGVIGGGEGSFIVGGKGMYGLLTGTDDTSHVYYYESEGVSIGAQEGGVAAVGLYLHDEDPKDDWCVEIFSAVSGAVIAGVAIEGFTTVSTGSGFVVLVTTGEELEASFGASYSTWSAVDE